MNMTSSHQEFGTKEGRKNTPERFMFDVSFDLPEPLPEELPPPPPVFSEKEVEVAAASARAEGFEAGKQAALQELEQQLIHQLEAFRGELLALQSIKQQQDAQVTSQAVGLTLASLKQLLPSLNASQAMVEIGELIRQAIQQQLDNATLNIRLHPNLVDPMTKCFLDEDIKLIADNSLALGDCTISWPGGSLARRVRQATDELQAKLAVYVTDVNQDDSADLTVDQQATTDESVDNEGGIDAIPNEVDAITDPAESLDETPDSESMLASDLETAPTEIAVVDSPALADELHEPNLNNS